VRYWPTDAGIGWKQDKRKELFPAGGNLIVSREESACGNNPFLLNEPVRYTLKILHTLPVRYLIEYLEGIAL
jgi:hypothetical protein